MKEFLEGILNEHGNLSIEGKEPVYELYNALLRNVCPIEYGFSCIGYEKTNDFYTGEDHEVVQCETCENFRDPEQLREWYCNDEFINWEQWNDIKGRFEYIENDTKRILLEIAGQIEKGTFF